jgi:hypothetical protein
VGRFRRTVLLATAGLLAGQLAGCQRSHPAPPPLPGAGMPTASAATSPGPSAGAAAEPGADLVKVTSSAPADRLRARVFADYVRFWQRDMVALRSNDLGRSGVLDYLFPPQLQTTATYLASQRRAGRHTEGAVSIHPEVMSVRSRYATITDCLDQSGSYDVDRSGRQIRPSGRPRLPLVVAVQLGRDNRWKVSTLSQVAGAC